MLGLSLTNDIQFFMCRFLARPGEKTTHKQALAHGLTCDITTTGRTSGKPRRIEIWYFMVDRRVYITRTPRPRDWYANLLAQPRMVFHVKEAARADLPARAIPITDATERQRI